MSGSQTGVTYQLQAAGYVGSSISGTGSAISWPNINVSTGNTYTVTATKSGCTYPTVVAAAYIMGAAALSSSDVIITADKTALYPGESIVFTVKKSPTGNPLQSFANYILFDGGAVGGATTNNQITVNSLPTHGSVYSILVNGIINGTVFVDRQWFLAHHL
jgi:hypothetical protein